MDALYYFNQILKDFKTRILNYFMSENGGVLSSLVIIFTFFFTSTVLVLRITDAKWEGVSVCKKASCSRKKDDIHQNK